MCVCVCVASYSTKRNYRIVSVFCPFNTTVSRVLYEAHVRLDHLSEIRRIATLLAWDTRCVSVYFLNISNPHLNNVDVPRVKRNILKLESCVCVCVCVCVGVRAMKAWVNGWTASLTFMPPCFNSSVHSELDLLTCTPLRKAGAPLEFLTKYVLN